MAGRAPPAPRVALALLALLSLVLRAPRASAQPIGHDRFMGSSWLKYYDVSKTVDYARSKLALAGVTDTTNRLPLMMLWSFDWKDGIETRCLHCALVKYQKNLAKNTPLDIFVFVKPEQLYNAPEWLVSNGGRWRNVHIIPIELEHWRMPDAIRPVEKGWSVGFSDDYRLMGHWRLAFQFPIAKELGYQYMLQADGDTYLDTELPYNMVEHMRSRDVWLSNPNSFFYEVRGYQTGLPELARFYLITRKVGQRHHDFDASTARGMGIYGPILDHVRPPNIEGLHTISHDSVEESKGNWTGWDGQCIRGHFNIFKLEWWFSKDVQDFLHLLLRTGAHIEHRWVDVATESMINHLFCDPKQFYAHSDLRVLHGKDPNYCTAQCIAEGDAMPVLPPRQRDPLHQGQGRRLLWSR